MKFTSSEKLREFCDEYGKIVGLSTFGIDNQYINLLEEYFNDVNAFNITINDMLKEMEELEKGMM